MTDHDPYDVMDEAFAAAPEGERRVLCRILDSNYRSCVAELMRAANRLDRHDVDAAAHLRREARDLAINAALRVTAAGRSC